MKDPHSGGTHKESHSTTFYKAFSEADQICLTEDIPEKIKLIPQYHAVWKLGNMKKEVQTVGWDFPVSILIYIYSQKQLRNNMAMGYFTLKRLETKFILSDKQAVPKTENCNKGN